MRSAFLTGEDIHAVTASQVFGIPLDEVTPQMRSHAKAVNFGIVYGLSLIHISRRSAAARSRMSSTVRTA